MPRIKYYNPATEQWEYADSAWGSLPGEATALSPEAIGYKIVTGKIRRILLVGNSITDGYGGSGYNGDMSGGLSTNTRGYCWANALKRILENRYAVTVENKGMYGTLAAHQVAQMTEFVGKDDLVIWLTGTNNRAREETFVDYRDNLAAYIDRVKSMCAGLLVVSGPPSTEANERQTYASMRSIDEVVLAAAWGKTPVISMYREYAEYCDVHGIRLADTFVDALHPNDLGHYVMLRVLCDKIGVPLDPYTDYRYGGNWWSAYGTVLLDTGSSGSGPLVSWDDTTLPLIQMAQYDADALTTLFSGRTIRGIKLVGNGVAAGTATVGTQALDGPLNIENRATVSVDEGGVVDFGDGGFYVPEHHTLALFAPEDTCRASYSFTEVTAENYMYIPGQWSAEEKPAPTIKICAVFYV